MTLAARGFANFILLLMAGACWLSGAVTLSAEPVAAERHRQQAGPRLTQFSTDVMPFLRKFCIDCHGGDAPEAGLRLDKFRTQLEAGRQPQQWHRVLEQLQQERMPPVDFDPHPTPDEISAVLSWIDKIFINVDCAQQRDPGRVTIRRLNRTEYDHTIRDLLGVDVQPAADFPSDDVGYGFDNIGDVLTLSPLLLEKYLHAAETVTTKMLSSVHLTQPHLVRFEGPELSGTDSAQLNQYEFYMITSTGTVYAEFPFPFDGDYVLRTRVTADQSGDEPVKMALHLDGKSIRTFDVERHRESAFFETRVHVKAGERRFAVEFLNDFEDPDAPNEGLRDRNLGVHVLEVEGPFGVSPDAARDRIPATRSRIIICTPGPDRTAEECARAIFTVFASRAYRRPVTEDETARLVRLVLQGIEHGESFTDAVQLAMQAVLVSPHFLFRVERDRDPHDPRQIHRLADFELASRLSYFLWSTMPDETLFDLARRGQLAQPKVLQQQVLRMLQDPKSRALVDNFASQWLNLRNLDLATPNQRQFETFSDDLRRDMRQETEMLFAAVMQQDLSVLTFLDANFTFVNERLAQHYGIHGIEGTAFRRVSLAGSQRMGVLTHASILTLTSDPTKTSPVKRGKWILENLLGTPPPPPPPQVPPLDVVEKARPNASLREQLAQHRSVAACASCHKEMDPFGLALENFDAVGRWRVKDGDRPVDPSGILPSGEQVDGVVSLIDVLRGREEAFCRHFVRSLLTYALGRGLEYYDVCAVNQITQALRADGYRFSRAVQAVVSSEPFLMRRGDGANE